MSHFQKIARMNNFWHFWWTLSTQNVNVARFVRNVACDFFYDFQTQWITWNVPLWIWVVICHKKQLVRNEWLLVVISNTTVLRIQASKSPKGIAASAFVATTIPADTFHPHLPCWEGVCWDKQRLKTWYGNIFIIQTLQNTKFSFFFPLRAFQKHQTKFRKQNCGAGNENPVFELRRRFFFQRCFTFFEGGFFYGFGKVS